MVRGWHVMRGGGDGTTFYFGRHQGARFIGVSLRGFDGWSSSRWMPGGWAFFTPHIHVGRLFTDRKGRWWSARVLLPARLVDLWRMRHRSYREAMREQPLEELPGANDGQSAPLVQNKNRSRLCGEQDQDG